MRSPNPQASSSVTAGVTLPDDTKRLDCLEALYSDTAHEPEAWRQFMGQVAALGFRESIDRVLRNPALTSAATPGVQGGSHG